MGVAFAGTIRCILKVSYSYSYASVLCLLKLASKIGLVQCDWLQKSPKYQDCLAPNQFWKHITVHTIQPNLSSAHSIHDSRTLQIRQRFDSYSGTAHVYTAIFSSQFDNSRRHVLFLIFLNNNMSWSRTRMALYAADQALSNRIYFQALQWGLVFISATFCIISIQLYWRILRPTVTWHRL